MSASAMATMGGTSDQKLLTNTLPSPLLRGVRRGGNEDGCKDKRKTSAFLLKDSCFIRCLLFYCGERFAAFFPVGEMSHV